MDLSLLATLAVLSVLFLRDVRLGLGAAQKTLVDTLTASVTALQNENKHLKNVLTNERHRRADLARRVTQLEEVIQSQALEIAALKRQRKQEVS